MRMRISFLPKKAEKSLPKDEPMTSQSGMEKSLKRWWGICKKNATGGWRGWKENKMVSHRPFADEARSRKVLRWQPSADVSRKCRRATLAESKARNRKKKDGRAVLAVRVVHTRQLSKEAESPADRLTSGFSCQLDQHNSLCATRRGKCHHGCCVEYRRRQCQWASGDQCEKRVRRASAPLQPRGTVCLPLSLSLTPAGAAHTHSPQ